MYCRSRMTMGHLIPMYNNGTEHVGFHRPEEEGGVGQSDHDWISDPTDFVVPTEAFRFRYFVMTADGYLL